jgi:hypothetical protein
VTLCLCMPRQSLFERTNSCHHSHIWRLLASSASYLVKATTCGIRMALLLNKVLSAGVASVQRLTLPEEMYSGSIQTLPPISHNLKVLTTACTQSYWVSGLSPFSGILNTRKQVLTFRIPGDRQSPETH